VDKLIFIFTQLLGVLYIVTGLNDGDDGPARAGGHIMVGGAILACCFKYLFA
jgi:hypothetical protein